MWLIPKICLLILLTWLVVMHTLNVVIACRSSVVYARVYAPNYARRRTYLTVCVTGNLLCVLMDSAFIWLLIR